MKKKRYGKSDTKRGYTATEINNAINRFLNTTDGKRIYKYAKIAYFENTNEKLTLNEFKRLIRVNTKSALKEASEKISTFAEMTGRGSKLTLKKAIEDVAVYQYASQDIKEGRYVRELIKMDKTLNQKYGQLAGKESLQYIGDIKYMGSEDKTQIFYNQKKGIWIYKEFSPKDGTFSTIEITKENRFGIAA